MERIRTYIIVNLNSGAYSSILPDWLVEDHSRLDRVYAKLNEWERAQPGPFCLVHGDSHMGNTYIYPDGHRIWFDWQLCRVGHGLRDVCYFMVARSEEHTSELQSLMRISYAVFCLK